MPEKQCINCNKWVAMKHTPQTLRKYCPKCYVVQTEREMSNGDMRAV